MHLNDFFIGQHIQFQHHSGYVTFIDNRYITICINEYDKSLELAQHSKHPTNQVNLLIFRENFHLCQRTTVLHQNHTNRTNHDPVENSHENVVLQK